MAELKTKATKNSVAKFLNAVKPDERREDSLTLLKLFKKATGQKPVLWGAAIVGFGKFSYKSKSSAQAGDWFYVGFSPRKQNLTLYIKMYGAKADPLLAKLGKHKAGGGCLYINKLANVDKKVLATLIKKSYQQKKKMYSKMFPK